MPASPPRRLILAGLVLALAASLGLWLTGRWRAAQPTDAERIERGLELFAAGMATGRLSDSLSVFSSAFEMSGYRKPDVVRGLAAVRREYADFTLSILDLTVEVDAAAGTAVSQVECVITGNRLGREVQWGLDRPMVVTVDWRREGRDWRIVGARNVPVAAFSPGF